MRRTAAITRPIATTPRGHGARRFAVSINLNEDFEGGEVSFSEYGPRSFRPPSRGVVFSCSLLHRVSRVTRGRRYAFLPFLYDDAAALIRRRTRAGRSAAARRAGRRKVTRRPPLDVVAHLRCGCAATPAPDAQRPGGRRPLCRAALRARARNFRRGSADGSRPWVWLNAIAAQSPKNNRPCLRATGGRRPRRDAR